MMLERTPESELMDDEAQALAYARADFEEPHQRFIDLFRERFPGWAGDSALDLGCGPGDITIRFARAFRACEIHGVDGAEAMLRLGRGHVNACGLNDRIRLVKAYLPGPVLPRPGYEALISNSLLHHLAEPGVLWEAIRTYAVPGAPVFVMDLLRPDSAGQARAMVEHYTDGEPDVLRRDFYNSLLAAYRVDEVQQQLAEASLDNLRVGTVSDRHLIVWGTM